MKTRKPLRKALLVTSAVFLSFLSNGLAANRVLVVGVSEEQLADLQKAVPQADLFTAEGDELVSKVLDADALIGTCDPELVRSGKKLRWVQVNSAGVSYCMYPELVDSDIVLTNAKIIQGPEISDHALALLLFLTRNLGKAFASMQAGEWNRQQAASSVELRGKTALVIGLGGIGTQVAERASAFGMKVLGIDPKDIPYINSVERVGKPDQLNSFLPSADVVFMCAPITPESSLMFDREEFSLMKKGAFFINVSRGKIVNTQALVEALRSGHLAGAGLDVTEPEPLPKDHPLWTLENVIITPHVAGRSDGITQRRMELFGENLRRFEQDLPLRNVVDKQRGY
jgi:phosphoglycerate dehydrogenase-like enzyme